MKTKYWLLTGAILVSAYVCTTLVWETDQSDTHFQAEKIRQRAPAATGGLPASAIQGVPAKGFASKPKRGASGPSPEIAPDVTEREELTPAGLPVGDPGYPDPAEVENRLLTEQLAESLRNPAYLQAVDEEPSEDIDPDTLEETEAEVLEDEEFVDDPGEQETAEEVAVSDADPDEAPAESDQSTGRPQLTEAGVEISEHGSLDPAEVEKRLLNEQLAESLRNPAYLQSDSEEEATEEIEDEE
jgi:hypothetical protein